MKKKTIAGLIAIVAIAAIAMFAGCIEEPPSAPTVTPTPAVTPTTTKATPTPTPTPKTELSLGESVVVGNISFTVVKYEFTDSYEARYPKEKYTHRPPEGAKYLWVYVKAKNVGELAYYIPGNYGVDLLYKGEEIMYTSPNWFYEKEMYYGGTKIYPDITEEGWILYEVPKGIETSQAKICVEFYPKAGYGRGKTMTWSLAS